jgi:hypothetical protein
MDIVQAAALHLEGTGLADTLSGSSSASGRKQEEFKLHILLHVPKLAAMCALLSNVGNQMLGCTQEERDTASC